jgi:hypothetical protein
MGQNVAYGNSSNGPVVQHNVLAIDQRVADFIDATSATWKGRGSPDVPFPAVESLTTGACQTWDPHVSD